MRVALALLLSSLGALPAAAQTSAGGGVDGARSVVWDNGDTFTGAFRNGRPNGPGTYRTAGGEVHSGEWRDGCLVGGRGYRVAVFTALKDCPPPPRRRAPFPRSDFR